MKLKKSCIWKIALIVLGAIFFLVGIPIIINEAYKCDSGYLTLWNAADVLSYYGTIIGASSTIVALAVTISFTRNQISRDGFLKNESEKWARIESTFAKILNEINPMQPMVGTIDTGFTNPSVAIGIFQKYQMSCRITTDQLNAILSSADFPKVKSLIEEINKASDQFFQICTEEIAMYSKLRDFLSRDTAIQTLQIEMEHPNSFSQDDLSSCKRILDVTDGLRIEDIEGELAQINEKMISAYQTTYRSLLQLKGTTFELINRDIQSEAESILRLWRKKDRSAKLAKSTVKETEKKR